MKFIVTIGLGFTITTAPALAFDITDLHCIRHEQQGELVYLSEISFHKANTSRNQEPISISRPSPYEGELVSYQIRGTQRRYISGYNLFSISYHDDTISGLTGDPITRSDGSFTLSKKGYRPTGPWIFAYTSTNGSTVNAEFKCIYSSFDEKSKSRF